MDNEIINSQHHQSCPGVTAAGQPRGAVDGLFTRLLALATGGHGRVFPGEAEITAAATTSNNHYHHPHPRPVVVMDSGSSSGGGAATIAAAGVIRTPHSTVSGGELSTASNAIAGGIAGALTRTCIAPLDVVKIRWQLQREPSVRGLYRASEVKGAKYFSVGQTIRTITKEEGLQSLWKGNLLAEGFWICAMGVQFAAYHRTRKFFENAFGANGPSFCNEQQFCQGTTLSLLGGAVAGLNAAILAYPLDMLHTRFAAQPEPKIYPNIRTAIGTIYRGQGVWGFYRGLAPTVAQVVPYIALQFGVYENMKAIVPERERNSSAIHGLCGTASGAIAKTFVMPLDAAKKRMQISGFVNQDQYKSTFDCIKKVVAKEGARGLYVGTWPSLLKSGLQTGLGFVFYEKIVGWLGGKEQR